MSVFYRMQQIGATRIWKIDLQFNICKVYTIPFFEKIFLHKILTFCWEETSPWKALRFLFLQNFYKIGSGKVFSISIRRAQTFFYMKPFPPSYTSEVNGKETLPQLNTRNIYLPRSTLNLLLKYIAKPSKLASLKEAVVLRWLKTLMAYSFSFSFRSMWHHSCSVAGDYSWWTH